MPAANKNEKQVMDVSKPGKTPPSASAKPVIVGHGPMVQDPMVTADTNGEANNPAESQAQPVATPSATKKVITPLSELNSKAEPKTEASLPATNKDTSGPEIAPEEPVMSSQSSEASDEAAVVDAVIEQVGEKKADEPNEEDRKKHEKIEKLIAERKYFVPLGKVHHGSGGAFKLVIFLVIIFLVGLVAAIDAQVIDTGLELPFDLL